MKVEYDFSEAERGAAIPQTGKTRITIYIDDDVLETFRERSDSAGKGYQTMMNEALRQYLEKPRNWSIKIISGIVLGYLIFSLLSPMLLKQEQQPRKIETPDLLLIALVLLFNSGLIDKLKNLEITKEGNLKLEISDLNKKVDTLSGAIDDLLLGTVLDAFEYVTLQDLKEKKENEFSINPSGYALLERLRNRGLIKEESNVLNDRSERKISLNKSFSITEQGCRYLKAVDDKGIGQNLRQIAKHRMHGN